MGYGNFGVGIKWYKMLLICSFIHNNFFYQSITHGILHNVADKIPKIDLAFAISAATSDADRTFRLMQDTIKSVVTKYGTTDILYSIITFGPVPVVQLRFGSFVGDSDRLKRLVDNIPRQRGVPALDKALEKGKDVFEDPGARNDAKKVNVSMVS